LRRDQLPEHGAAVVFTSACGSIRFDGAENKRSNQKDFRTFPDEHLTLLVMTSVNRVSTGSAIYGKDETAISGQNVQK
jgi:hypothetical protein